MRHQDHYALPSLLLPEGASPVTSPADWYGTRLPQLQREWTTILGKLGPDAKDRTWFADPRTAVIGAEEARQGYRRIQVSIPMEVDLWQPHLLLVPEGQGPGPFPTVIAWADSQPSGWEDPEEWWGAWLAQHGYVVLTGWSAIRNYRGGDDYPRLNERLYERFGRWMPIARMVYDVRQEIRFLKSRSDVDEDRLGFIGFSLSGKVALFVGAFAPEVRATVSIDPHLAFYGGTRYDYPWYMDWKRPFPDISTPDYPDPHLRGTVWSLLDADPGRPGFEHNSHELLAMCAPRAMMVIGLRTDQRVAHNSDDLQSVSYVNRAQEVYDLLGLPDRLQYVQLDVGHRPTGPGIDSAWQGFFDRWLKGSP
jgi:hypothetical protein